MRRIPLLKSKILRIALAGTALTALAFGAQAQEFAPEQTECIAPANPGGGWDFTCRQVGKTLQDLGLIPGTMQVTNMAGGGGGVAYAQVANKRNDDNDLIVAASSATATRLAQGAYPGNSMDQMRWIAAVGADYGVIAVAKDSTGRVYSNRVNNGLLSYYVSPNDTLEVAYRVPDTVNVAFNVLEYSFDLLKNPLFTMDKRPSNTMTKPFVFNDAIVQKRWVHPRLLEARPKDSLNTELDD